MFCFLSGVNYKNQNIEKNAHGVLHDMLHRVNGKLTLRLEESVIGDVRYLVVVIFHYYSFSMKIECYLIFNLM